MKLTALFAMMFMLMAHIGLSQTASAKLNVQVLDAKTSAMVGANHQFFDGVLAAQINATQGKADAYVYLKADAAAAFVAAASTAGKATQVATYSAGRVLRISGAAVDSFAAAAFLSAYRTKQYAEVALISSANFARDMKDKLITLAGDAAVTLTTTTLHYALATDRALQELAKYSYVVVTDVARKSTYFVATQYTRITTTTMATAKKITHDTLTYTAAVYENGQYLLVVTGEQAIKIARDADIKFNAAAQALLIHGAYAKAFVVKNTTAAWRASKTLVADLSNKTANLAVDVANLNRKVIGNAYLMADVGLNFGLNVAKRSIDKITYVVDGVVHDLRSCFGKFWNWLINDWEPKTWTRNGTGTSDDPHHNPRDFRKIGTDDPFIEYRLSR